jgi:TRAP transporter TAXI family solute receptor
MAVKEFLRANWPLVAIGVTAIAILGVAILLLHTMPPRAIVMATGPKGGAYYEIGKRYQAVLERAGERLTLIETAGSLENLALLRGPVAGVQVALVQGGIIGKDEAPELVSLGTLFYEPLWIFHRSELHGLTPGALRGRKVSIGPIGSGTRALMLELLKRNGLDQQLGELLSLAPDAAADKLLAGEIDVAAFVAQWDAPLVQRLIADERVGLANVPRADAYVALYPFLSKVTVPRGMGDLAKDLPPTDVTLFAPEASLVVRRDLHPAIQDLLLTAAVQIHSGDGTFHRAGRFPAAEGIDLPLSEAAVQFYKSGQPFLQNNLPFWIASFVGRLLVLLIPIVAVVYPMMRFLPALYDWLMRSKITRLYGELRFLEDEIGAVARADNTHLVARLDQIEKRANALRLPIAYESMMYLLRNQIAVVRDQLKAR